MSGISSQFRMHLFHANGCEILFTIFMLYQDTIFGVKVLGIAVKNLLATLLNYHKYFFIGMCEYTVS